MAKKRYTPEQISAYLRRAEAITGQGKSMDEVIRALKVTGNTYYRWRKQYGGMATDQAKRLKELEADSTRVLKPDAAQAKPSSPQPENDQHHLPYLQKIAGCSKILSISNF